MKVLISGGTGFVGRFIAEELFAAGHDVVVTGRTRPADGFFSRPVGFATAELGTGRDWRALFEGVDAFVHAAFHHLPGRYRGGEGEDPKGFRQRNLDGSAALFEAARAAGVARTVFISTRAVYGTQPAGAVLTEDTVPRPDTLYGEIKLAAERRLAALCGAGFTGTSLRVTGVYGPAGAGQAHKWSGLFDDFLAGRPIEPRVSTEVHGTDLATAVSLMLSAPIEVVTRRTFNVSDIVLDRSELLAILREVAATTSSPPPAADPSGLNIMDCTRLKALGWQPGGRPLLARTARQLGRQAAAIRVVP
ncbi:MAG: NAD(P)-dependent oxidoreductase [Rhizobiaceae bacterium]|nr:NAD(P)-dependent oxidoreductase [Rhizobiaceae bacterium]MCV0408575.1 NAD(P)-dependent oxidoreductase [Rhizobiaceae bacterium]